MPQTRGNEYLCYFLRLIVHVKLDLHFDAKLFTFSNPFSVLLNFIIASPLNLFTPVISIRRRLKKE